MDRSDGTRKHDSPQRTAVRLLALVSAAVSFVAIALKVAPLG